MRNRCFVTVLQHPRERTHPFGTARFVRLGLERSSVLPAGYGNRSGLLTPLPLTAGTALLYPRPDATSLAELPPADRPDGLLILDGTWAHAHSLYRDNPWLARLPHVQLSDTAPSRYQIRRQPGEDCLSTLEAAVAALQILEPETRGLDRLIEAFEAMVATQVGFTRGEARRPRGKRRRVVA